MAVAKRAVQPQRRGVKARLPAAGAVCRCCVLLLVAGLMTAVRVVMRWQVRACRGCRW